MPLYARRMKKANPCWPENRGHTRCRSGGGWRNRSFRRGRATQIAVGKPSVRKHATVVVDGFWGRGRLGRCARCTLVESSVLAARHGTAPKERGGVQPVLRWAGLVTSVSAPAADRPCHHACGDVLCVAGDGVDFGAEPWGRQGFSYSYDHDFRLLKLEPADVRPSSEALRETYPIASITYTSLPRRRLQRWNSSCNTAD